MTKHTKQPQHHKICHLIDAETYHRTVITEVFRHAGYKVYTFKSLDEYFHYLNTSKHEHPDALISDTSTTKVQGYEIAMRISQKKALRPLLLMTSFDRHRKMKRVLKQLYFMLTTSFLQKTGY